MKTIKTLLTAVLLAANLAPLYAQRETFQAIMPCPYSYSEKFKASCQDYMSFHYDVMEPDNPLRKSVDEILTLTALRPQSMILGIMDEEEFGVYAKPNDKIARIMIGRKYAGNYWVAMGIICHELGHLLNHHENLCSNPSLEDDADIFAGRCLALLKATKKQATSQLDLIDDKDMNLKKNSPKSKRMENIMIGYEHFYKSINLNSFATSNSIIRWKKSKNHCEVFIEDRTLKLPMNGQLVSFPGGEFNGKYGILYIKNSNATYQLTNFRENGKGIGNLVNDKTTLTYMRWGKGSYFLFDAARNVRISGNRLLKDTISSGNGIDYELLYKQTATADEFRQVVFKDYFYSPNYFLRPAFFR